MWQEKAHRIIRSLCEASYRRAGNRPGRKHRPYTVPPLAAQLVELLGAKDQHEAEERAKALFLLYEHPTEDMQW